MNWKKSFTLIAGGQAVSLLGSHGVQFALIWYLAERTNSALMLGLAGIVAYVPQVIFGPLAGIVADRYDQRFVSVAADVSMGIVAASYALLLAHRDLPAWSVLLVLAARGIGDTFQEPAIQSLLPTLVPKTALGQINGWLQLLRGGAFLFGPPIGAMLYATLALPWVLLSDIVGAVFASTALLCVRLPAGAGANPAARFGWRSWWVGVQAIKAHRALAVMIAADAVTMSLYAPLASLYPLMTSGYFKLSALYGSAVEFSFAIGMLVSALLFATVVTMHAHLRWSRRGIAMMGLAACLCGLLPPTLAGWGGFAVACALLAAAGNLHSIPLTTAIQQTIPADQLGRALSVQTMGNGLMMPVGLAFASPVADKIGVPNWFVVAGLGMVGCFILASVWLRRLGH